MKSALNKDIIRDIKKSKGRFLSILCIVALGVAFFSGIKISPMVMEKTSDSYYDDYNLMDIKVISTLGLTDEDVDEIRKIRNVEGVQATYTKDVIAKYNTQQEVMKVHALDLNDIQNNSGDYINQVNVVEGRLPNKSGECVLEKSKIDDFNVPIGSKITIESGTDEEITDSIKNREYTVVGKVETPYYLSHEKGNSSIGNGSISGVIMVPEEDFKIDAYTEILVTAKNVKQYNSYEDKYFNEIDKVVADIEDISDSRIEVRYNEVIVDARDELDKGKAEYNENKDKVENELNSADAEINKHINDIKKGEVELASKKEDTKNQINNGKYQIEQGQKELEAGYVEYEKALKLFNDSEESVESEFTNAQIALDEINSKIKAIEDRNLVIEEKLKDESLSEEEQNILNQELVANNESLMILKPTYESGSKELDNKKQEYNNAKKQLESAKITLDSTKKKLEQEKSNLYDIESKAEIEFKKAQQDIDKGKKEIELAKVELETAKKEAEEELLKAENEIKDAEEEIEKIEKPQWYILDRNSHYSYVEYGSCAESIDALSKVFPVFFFSVAALVCLTTMTRMVDEQRINIGTLKALGYTTGKIAKKYILYALIASLIGSILGIIIGYTVFPIVIFNAYGIMFTLPDVQLLFDIKLAVGVTLVAVLITTLAAYSACYKELKETPSVLMRPRAPKEGKRILLERIPFIWNKIGFIGKVTIRNIFRYKKRFMMTVLGISGCSALILAGLGIQDSIQMIVDGQYGSIFKYDMSITIDKNSSESEIEKVNTYLDNNSTVDEYDVISSKNGKLAEDGKEKLVNIIVPKDSNDIDTFIGLQDRKTQEKIDINKSGIVITEKAARDLGVKVGDKISLIDDNDKKVEATISDVTENYISHYVYMDKEYYKELFNKEVRYNQINGNINDTSLENEETLSNELNDNEIVSGVSFNTGAKENFENTIKSLNYVVLIMTVSAGALAFVVLYNLTNVNISERIREIATIKVLGFYDNEVSSYIYRENIILTVIGTLVGLGIGNVLHQFIMVTVEMENMMYGRVIEQSSYIIAGILTIVLGLIVNFAMYYKLKNVKMVESLKSVD